MQVPLLSLNLVSRDYAALLRPLNFQQTAPVLYLEAERAAISVLGVHDASLRLLSLISGIALLFLVWRLALRIGGPYVAPLATGIVAVSENLTRYSNEVKPYELDAAGTAALLLLAAPILTGEASARQRAVLLLAGCIAVLSSTPSIFVLLGVAAALAIRDYQSGFNRSRIIWLVACVFWWTVLFVVVYQAVYAPIAGPGYMKEFWVPAQLLAQTPRGMLTQIVGALTVPPFGVESGVVTPAVMRTLFTGGDSIAMSAVRMLSLSAGLYAIARRFGAAGMALTGLPMAMPIFAAVVGRWFLTTRLMLFLAPLSGVVIAAGTWWLAERLSLRCRIGIFFALSGVLLLVPAKFTFYRVRHPEIQANRELVADCWHRAKAGDVIYIYPRTTAAWVYYSTDWSQRASVEATRLMSVIESIGPNAGNAPQRGHAVVHEGFDNRFLRSHHVELFGVATGIQGTMARIEEGPDPGWANNEIERMRREKAKQTWIVASMFEEKALQLLIHSLDDSCVEQFHEGPQVVLYRVVWSSCRTGS